MIATYSGTFDPITLGHLDIMLSAEKIFPKLYIAVAENSPKKTLFSLSERVQLIKGALPSTSSIEVMGFSGLLVDFLREHGSTFIVRGLRNASDFDYEFQMAGTNKILMPECETIFFTPKVNHQFISSSAAKQISELGGDLSHFVPPLVAKAMHDKRSRKKILNS